MNMNKHSLPFVSFVIPTYNAQKYLDKCLVSIERQDYPRDRMETFVIDGGSNDETLSIAKKYDVKILKNPYRDAESGKSIGIQLSFLGYPISGPIILAHAIIAAEHPAIKTRTRALSQGRKLMEAMMKMGCVPHRVGTDFLPLVAKRLSPEYYGLVKKIKKLLDPRGVLRPEIIEPM